MYPFLYYDVGTLIEQNKYGILSEGLTNPGKALLALLIYIGYFRYSTDNFYAMRNNMSNDFYFMFCSKHVKEDFCKV
jgi:hypothetical protein